MVSRLPTSVRILVPIVMALAALGGWATPAAGVDRFDVGLTDPSEAGFGEVDPAGAYDAARAANSRVIRIPVAWFAIAQTEPANPKAPEDPAYEWGNLDGRVREIVNRGMEPLLSIYGTPSWARTSKSYGTTRSTPRPEDFAAFAEAAARRYTGATAGLPRVRYFQLWNEPNLGTYLDPSDSVDQYRAMVNAAYAAIHGVSAANRVVAGGLAPYASSKDDIAPLRFMRELLCMSGGSHPHATCTKTISFDIWSHHPYTTGGPNHSAAARDDVSLGDLPEMHRLLQAADHAGHVKPGKPDFWITEFSWDTKGPDPDGVPLARHARWVAQAFYNMWRSGVSLCVWFQLRDNPKGTFTWGQTWQSGLYFRTTEKYAQEKAKPVRQVLRFPFVALPEGGGARIWGRTPTNGAASVTIERRSGSKWLRVTSLKAGAYGVFNRRLSGNSGALLRARVGSDASVPFKVERTPDVRVNPFGGPVK
jgi:hypothetical protein